MWSGSTLGTTVGLGTPRQVQFALRVQFQARWRRRAYVPPPCSSSLRPVYIAVTPRKRSLDRLLLRPVARRCDTQGPTELDFRPLHDPGRTIRRHS